MRRSTDNRNWRRCRMHPPMRRKTQTRGRRTPANSLRPERNFQYRNRRVLPYSMAANSVIGSRARRSAKLRSNHRQPEYQDRRVTHGAIGSGRSANFPNSERFTAGQHRKRLGASLEGASELLLRRFRFGRRKPQAFAAVAMSPWILNQSLLIINELKLSNAKSKL